MVGVRLSPSFLRDFLHSEIADLHGILNIPDDPELAIAAGRRICAPGIHVLYDAIVRQRRRVQPVTARAGFVTETQADRRLVQTPFGRDSCSCDRWAVLSLANQAEC